MPLFMDFHKLDSEGITKEDVFRAHLRDIAVQDKFGIIYKKYYLSLQTRTAFCLMESPSKEACIASHIEAHGVAGACNIIEVSPEFEFHPYMGEGSRDENDLALTLSGEIDTGYRTLIMVRVTDFKGTYKDCMHEIQKSIKNYQGSKIAQPNEVIMASFIHASDAFECCLALNTILHGQKPKIDYTMAMVTGKPVDEVGSEFFGNVKKQLQILCQMGQSEIVHIDGDTRNLTQKQSDLLELDNTIVNFVSTGDFSFLESLYKILDAKLNDSNLRSDFIGRELGLSKAQAYRKIKSITGHSPNSLIREMRLRRSLNALKKQNKTVAEIAYELGFNSPTYFTRVFKNRYQVLPTSFAKLSIIE